MTNGNWGGRLPIGNLLVTKSLFSAVRLRLAYQGLRNRIRPAAVDAPKLRPSLQLHDEIGKWLDRGYDKLNVGGGRKQLEGFVNVDFVRYPEVPRQVLANILDLSFVPDSSISHVHSNHVIEHLSEVDINSQLMQYRRMLKPGGRISIRCPNALGAAYGFWFEPILEAERGAFVALGFPPEETFGIVEDRWCHRDVFAILHWFYGEVGNVTNSHLTQVTPSYLLNCLIAANFKILKASAPEALNLVVVAEKQAT